MKLFNRRIYIGTIRYVSMNHDGITNILIAFCNIIEKCENHNRIFQSPSTFYFQRYHFIKRLCLNSGKKRKKKRRGTFDRNFKLVANINSRMIVAKSNKEQIVIHVAHVIHRIGIAERVICSLWGRVSINELLCAYSMQMKQVPW